MDERMPLASEPKTRAEYRAAIREMLDELRRLFAEMDRNQEEFDRNWAERKAARDQTRTTLDDLQAQLERLRHTGRRDAERAP